MSAKICPKCGSNRAMIKDDLSAGVCYDCPFSWTGGYPCICGDKRGQYPTGSRHHTKCPMHRDWYYTNVAQVTE